jgi:hypothetical protein
MDQSNHNIIEQDIERLGKEIAEKKALAEHKELSEKELLRQALEPLVKQPISQPIKPQKQPAPSTEEQILPDYLKDSPAEIKLQVEKLIDSVFHQGIEKTVKEANKAGAFILDAFHDALTDKLYDELKSRKLI